MKTMFKKWIFSLILLAILGGGCNYYKPISVSPSNPSERTKYLSSLSSKDVIIRDSRGVFLLKNPSVNMTKEEINGTLAEVPVGNQTYLNYSGGEKSYSPSKSRVDREIHLFTRIENQVKAGDQVTIPLSAISSMEVIERDQKKSSSNTIVAISAATLATVGLVAIIASSGSDGNTPPPSNNSGTSSCPYIKVFNGQEFILQGETFGGAIYPSLSRVDYLPLPEAKVGSTIQLQISNELQEKQYVDMVDLILVEHSPQDRLVIDSKGELKLVKNPILPELSILNESMDVLDKVTSSDGNACLFNYPYSSTASNRLVLKFSGEPNSSNLGLVLSAKNSLWFDLMFVEYSSAFGEKYSKWVNYQKKRPAEELKEWVVSQNMPLKVSAKTREGWREVTLQPFVGPVMNREIAISLEGLEFPEGEVEIALETGFMFWELDKVELAQFQALGSKALTIVKPSSAIDEKGNDVKPYLLESDFLYYEQPIPGNSALVNYEFPNYSEGKSYSAFLITKGYYEPVRDFEGSANRKFLTYFKKPGAFQEFSRKRFLESVPLANSNLKKENSYGFGNASGN